VCASRRIGGTIGPFARVAASDVPRTLETALAMGFGVDEILPFPDDVAWDEVIGEIGWHTLWEIDDPFAHVERSLSIWPNATRMGAYYAQKWLNIGASLGDGESALMVSHGQLMEVAIVCCVPEADHATWGKPLAHCEGARLTVADGSITDVDILRVGEG
jgi:hypothetical protein